MNDILNNAKKNYDFFETPKHHGQYIYDNVNCNGLKVLDVCCGLGSLSEMFYNDTQNELTMIEFNKDFIPLLKDKFPRAKVMNEDFLTLNLLPEYDLILCNPPFNTTIKQVYKVFFMKLISLMNTSTKVYFICPNMFVENQIKINLDLTFSDAFSYLDFRKEYKQEPANFYYEEYKFIQLDSRDFSFNRPLIKFMVEKKVIDKNDIIEYEPNKYELRETLDIRFLKNINDFKNTNIKCILLKITY